ncbi:MAG TPA: PxKF domain-containing protein [Candidatus Polarisedimenticolia bacterium]|nr:PxKF domain-containing protein [Candidatus Polarisedimenticolia bacterium]
MRTDTARWGLHLKGYGHGEASIAARATAPHATANRVEYRRGTVTEWYVNGPLGLEQGFTLQARPGGHAGGPLTLALALSGDLSASLDPAREGVTLAQAGGAPTLRYSGLSASDAAGRELRAWMDLGDGEILLRVDDTCQAGACRSLSFAWTGVLQPINGDGTSIFKLGSTVPVKFQLTTPCVPTGTFTAKIFLAKITSDILGSEVEATSTSAADTGNTFRYDASGDQYIYNLATKTFTNGNTTPLSAGTWQIRIAQYNGTTEIGTMGTVIISLKK